MEPTPQPDARIEELEARLVELEIRYAHQSRLVGDLEEVVIDQGSRLRELERTIHQLSRRVEAGSSGMVDASIQEKPPHW